jgi:hypothetical protein
VTIRLLGLTAAVLVACSGDYGHPGDTGSKTPPADADGDGFSLAEGDCDDSDAAFYPGANDISGDAKDQNCDGTDGVDEDGDEHASQGSGGDDCDDADDTVYLGATEIGWDDIDQDCDGRDRFDFDEITAGKFHTCGLDSTGTIRCWGGDAKGQISFQPVGDGWAHVCSGFEYSCAIHSDGHLKCWGSDEDHIIQDAPTALTDLDQLSCGAQFACVLDRAGLATCWGDDQFQQVSKTPNAVSFTSIAAGGQFGCGVVAADGRIVCWGDDRAYEVKNQPQPSELNFIRVVAGVNYACAIRDDLGLRCWGDDSFYQRDAPSDAGP